MDKKLLIHDLAVMATSKHFANIPESKELYDVDEMIQIYKRYVMKIAPKLGYLAEDVLE